MFHEHAARVEHTVHKQTVSLAQWVMPLQARHCVSAWEWLSRKAMLLSECLLYQNTDRSCSPHINCVLHMNFPPIKNTISSFHVNFPINYFMDYTTSLIMKSIQDLLSYVLMLPNHFLVLVCMLAALMSCLCRCTCPSTSTVVKLLSWLHLKTYMQFCFCFCGLAVQGILKFL